MADLTVIIGFGGTAAFLGLAFVVWKRGQGGPALTTNDSKSARRDSGGEPPTEYLGREEILAAAERRGERGSGAEQLSREKMSAALGSQADAVPKTEFLSREEVLAARPGGTVPETEFLSREEVLDAANRRADEVVPGTEFLSREEVLAAAGRRAAEAMPETEFLSREEILASVQRAQPEPEIPTTEFLGREDVLAGARRGGPDPGQTPSRVVPVAFEGLRASEVSAQTPDIPSATLDSHFRECLDALEQVFDRLGQDDAQALASGPEQTWRGNMEVLSLTGQRVLDEWLLPLLRDREAGATRRLAAAMTLLELKGIKTTELVTELVSGLDDEGRGAIRKALGYWDDPRADRTISGLLEVSSPGHEQEWLDLCVDCGLEFDEARLRGLLESDVEARAVAGLRLLVFARDPAALAPMVKRQLFAKQPRVREAAIVAGLTLGITSAPMLCKQGARDPAMALVCQAHVLTGTAKDRAGLAKWASKPGAPDHASFALDLAERIQTPGEFQRVLRTTDVEVRRALSLAALVRSRGRVRVRVLCLPSQALVSLADEQLQHLESMK